MILAAKALKNCEAMNRLPVACQKPLVAFEHFGFSVKHNNILYIHQSLGSTIIRALIRFAASPSICHASEWKESHFSLWLLICVICHIGYGMSQLRKTKKLNRKIKGWHSFPTPARIGTFICAPGYSYDLGCQWAQCLGKVFCSLHKGN